MSLNGLKMCWLGLDGVQCHLKASVKINWLAQESFVAMWSDESLQLWDGSAAQTAALVSFFKQWPLPPSYTPAPPCQRCRLACWQSSFKPLTEGRHSGPLISWNYTDPRWAVSLKLRRAKLMSFSSRLWISTCTCYCVFQLCFLNFSLDSWQLTTDLRDVYLLQ